MHPNTTILIWSVIKLNISSYSSTLHRYQQHRISKHHQGSMTNEYLQFVYAKVCSFDSRFKIIIRLKECSCQAWFLSKEKHPPIPPMLWLNLFKFLSHLINILYFFTCFVRIHRSHPNICNNKYFLYIKYCIFSKE